jgi:hypothetical protein
MNLQVIEAALRAGPVDEPRYVPDAFRPAQARRWSVLLIGSAIAGALIVGAVIGLSVAVWRLPGGATGSPPDLVALAAQLQGRWQSQELTRDEWIGSLLEMGFDINDIEPFLDHDPIEERIHYELQVDGDRMTVSSAADGGFLTTLSQGNFRLLPDGRIEWSDAGASQLSGTCLATAEFQVDGEGLAFSTLKTAGCGVDERIAVSAFFNLSVYTRAP